MKAAAALLAISLVSGCIEGGALTQKGEARTFRYFTPERTAPAVTSAELAPAEAAPGRPAVALGPVRGGSHLRARIVHRESAHEIAFYDERRWTERPEEYVRRALARVLFEQRGFERIASGPGPELAVEVLAFEEVRLAHQHAGRVALRIELTDGRHVLVEDTLTVDRPVPAPGRMPQVVAAIGEALGVAAELVAQRVARAVRAAAARPELEPRTCGASAACGE